MKNQVFLISGCGSLVESLVLEGRDISVLDDYITLLKASFKAELQPT